MMKHQDGRTIAQFSLFALLLIGGCSRTHCVHREYESDFREQFPHWPLVDHENYEHNLATWQQAALYYAKQWGVTDSREYYTRDKLPKP